MNYYAQNTAPSIDRRRAFPENRIGTESEFASSFRFVLYFLPRTLYSGGFPVIQLSI
jgi:hypothetical protein